MAGHEHKGQSLGKLQLHVHGTPGLCCFGGDYFADAVVVAGSQACDIGGTMLQPKAAQEVELDKGLQPDLPTGFAPIQARTLPYAHGVCHGVLCILHGWYCLAPM